MAAKQRRTSKRGPVPALANNPILERLDGPPPRPPSPSESTTDKARRELLATPGQWMILNPRARLNEAAARRLARSFLRAKPSRLDETAEGRFDARPFLRNDSWYVVAVYEPRR